jgi:O-antigen ligase
MANLRSAYRTSEETSRSIQFGLFGLVFAAMIGTIFLSPALILASVLGVVAVFLTFYRPKWTLMALLWYLPFEPFLLKWIPDDVYIYARYFSEGLVYLLVAVVLAYALMGKIKHKSTPADIPFLLFIIILVASALVNLVAPWTAALGIRQIIRFILLFFITCALRPSKRWIKTLIAGLFVILAIQTTLGIGQAIIGQSMDEFLIPAETRTVGDIVLTSGTTQFWDYGERVFGTLGRYDRLGAFMAFVMLIIVALLYEQKKSESRTVRATLLVLSTIGIALTFSRSAWIGFMLGAFFIAVWAYRDRRVVWVTGLGVGVLAFYIAVTGLVVSQLTEVSDQNLAERFFEAFSYERWRGEYYGLGRMFWIVQTPLVVIPDSPLFGHGPASFGGGAVAALKNTSVYDDLSLPFGVYGSDGYIDNNWLSLWGETGTIGVSLYLWMYIALFITCIRVWRSSEDEFTRALAIGVAAAMISVSVNAFLATFLEVRTLAPYLWVLTACVVVLGQDQKKIA